MANNRTRVQGRQLNYPVTDGGVNSGDPVQVGVAPPASSALQAVVISVAPTGIPAGNVAANTTSDVALTGVTGLLATDILVQVTKAADQTGLSVAPGPGAQGGVTGAGAVTIRYINSTTAGITPTAGEVYTFIVLRAQSANTGAIFGVALNPKDGNGNAVVDTMGVYNLSVKGANDAGNVAIAVGDRVYYKSSDTPKLSAKTSGGFFGFALAAVNSGATTTIPVRLAGSN